MKTAISVGGITISVLGQSQVGCTCFCGDSNKWQLEQV